MNPAVQFAIGFTGICLFGLVSYGSFQMTVPIPEGKPHPLPILCVEFLGAIGFIGSIIFTIWQIPRL